MGQRDRPQPVPRANAYTGYSHHNPAKPLAGPQTEHDLEQITGTLNDAQSMGLGGYLPVAFGLFVLVVGLGVGYILRDIAREHRLALQEQAQTFTAELSKERQIHLDKIIRLTETMQGAIGQFISGSASQIGQLIAAAAQDRLALVNAMDLRAERAGRERDQLLETTTAALDANTRTMARTEKALDHHPRGRANGG